MYRELTGSIKPFVLALTVVMTVNVYAAAPAGLQQGISLYQKGYLAKALPVFEQAAKTAPDNEQVQLWLARTYLKQGGAQNMEKAKLAFSRVIQINGNNVEALSALGELFSWDPASRSTGINMLRRAVSLNPNDLATTRKLADALFWDGQNEEALQYGRQVTPKFSKDLKWMGSYAQILTRTGHGDEAIPIFENTLNIQASKDLNLLQSYALALYNTGQQEKGQQVYMAVKPYVQQLSDSGASLEAKKALGGLAFDLGLYNDAIEADSSLPAGVADEKSFQIRKARALAKAQRTPEAIDQFYKLYQAGQLNAAEKVEFADYLRSLELKAEALPTPNLVGTLYSEAARENPNGADSYLRLAQMYRFQDGHYNDAVQNYQLAMDNAGGNRSAVLKEYLEFLKTDKVNPQQSGQLLQQLVAANPGDFQVKSAYAEFLSYQQDKRAEALRMYLDMAKSDPSRADEVREQLDRVLGWHKPSTDLIPIYQEIVDTFHTDKTIQLSVARAYASNPDYFNEALDLYNKMRVQYANDPDTSALVNREWVGLLMADESHGRLAKQSFQEAIQQNPNNLEARTAYGKLLSYDHKFNDAFEQFDAVLTTNPDYKEAMLGKGYALMWSGEKLKAKKYFTELFAKYPNDIDVGLGLAQANKFLGRYSDAFEVMRTIRPRVNAVPADKSLRTANMDQQPDILHDIIHTLDTQSDMPVLAYERAGEVNNGAPPVPGMPAAYQTGGYIDETPTAAAVAMPVNPQAADLQSDIDSLSAAIDSINQVQQASQNQLNNLHAQLHEPRETLTASVSVGEDKDLPNAQKADGLYTYNLDEEQAVFSSLNYDTNPLLSGLGRFKNSELVQMESGLENDLRPMMRMGYAFSTQNGEHTTSKIRSWGFPNQVAFSLTPQVRMRFGVNPYKYYIPSGSAKYPDKTWSAEYTVGTTARITDKLTFDGDIALTHFNQSESQNLTYNAEFAYDFNDSIRAKIGANRQPQYNSLLTLAGLRPNQGAFANRLLGQARENGFFGELNLAPFNHNVDLNLGYQWSFIDGSRVPDNYKNQAFLSTGYTWNYARHHKVRFGYELFYMGYSKNTTNGFFDTTPTGLTRPVVSLAPPTLADSGYDFGGYFSPKWFIQNAGRLDFRGSLFKKALEYKLGASVGVQTFGFGHGIQDHADVSLTQAYDANLIVNMTDWMSAYGNVDYTDAGGAFERWRFGGGLIFRPHIDAVSPMFRKGDVPPIEQTNPPEER